MTRKEIEDISWELYKILECAETDGGFVAHMAIDAIENIVKKYPKIKEAIEQWKEAEESQ